MEASSELKTPRTSLIRRPQRGAYDFETVARILDEAIVCHIGFADDRGQPFVIPTAFGRDGKVLYFHGSSAGRTPRTLAGGTALCFTASIIDGLIYARSAFHNSINYRSVVVLGAATEVTGDEKLRAMRVITEHTMPGRWDDTRPPTEQELKATSALRLEITEASAKLRSGGPLDDDEDLALPHWAGVLPLSLVPGQPVTHEAVADGTATPTYVRNYQRPS